MANCIPAGICPLIAHYLKLSVRVITHTQSEATVAPETHQLQLALPEACTLPRVPLHASSLPPPPWDLVLSLDLG
eukprot:1159226-Pelagomonas_calceolata.AAC.9